jgi:hypothetical protein
MAAKHPDRIQLFASGSATGTSVAQVTIPSAGKLIGVQYSFVVSCKTDAGQARVELSKVPNNQIGTNGALDPILEVGTFTSFVTSGLAHSSDVGFLPLSVSVRQGEIIYLHATVAGTVTYAANFILIYG